jgi:glucokinase-like ROK family protein
VVSVAERVLDAVRSQSTAVAKADIVRLTELSLATVSEHVDLLREAGLLREEMLGVSSGGRRPKLYGFNPNAGHIVAIDLESTHVRVAVTDFGLKILHSDESYDIDVAQGPEITLNQIKVLVFAVLERAGVDRRAVKALGIGLPGPVSFSDGLPSSLSIMPGWESYPVSAFWMQHFNCISYIDNNVYTMALGERARDRSEIRDNMIFVKIGNGIGAGIVCNGDVYRGATEHAGEIGHTDTGHQGLCYCGNRGCLDAFAGGRAIAARAEALARQGQSERLLAVLGEKNKLTLRDVVKALEEADQVAVDVIRESGLAIGAVLAGLVNFFNPSRIVVGGGVSQVGDVMLAAIRQKIYQHALPLTTRRLVVEHSAVGINAGLIGAAVLALDQTIKRASLLDARPTDSKMPGAVRSVADGKTGGGHG